MYLKNYINNYFKAVLFFSPQDLVFAILVANNQLITLIRPKKYSLHPLGMFHIKPTLSFKMGIAFD